MMFVPIQGDQFYDLGGALGFLSTTFLSLYYPSLRDKYWLKTTPAAQAPLPAITSFHPRQLIISAMLGIWSARLGTYLASRAIKAGGDSRFDEIKKDPVKFTGAWMAQATWITVVGLPVYLLNTLPAHLHPALGVRDYAALALYGGSLIWEVVADSQKQKWRKERDEKKHDEKFISSGLWGYSRHPK
jgi:steroid 5-alpha reductase family enzyme